MDYRNAFQLAKAFVQMARDDRRLPVITRHELRVVRLMLGIHGNSGVLPRSFAERCEACGLVPEVEPAKFARAYREAEKVMAERKALKMLKHAEALPGVEARQERKPIAWRPRWERRQIMREEE